MTTNGYTKILRFENRPNLVENQLMEEMHNALLVKTRFDVQIPQINISLIGGVMPDHRCELLMIYMKGLSVSVESTEKQLKLFYKLSVFQIDN